jgi:hypothetical protein
MHEQWPDNKAKPLAIANLGVVETEAFKNPGQHLLTFSIRVSEHFHIGKATADIFSNEVLVRARFAAKSSELLEQLRVSSSGYTRPNHASQRCRDAGADLIGCQCR